MSQWIAETLIATTLLMIAVLLLRQPVARLCGARVAYLFWLAPGLRMLLPPLPTTWFPAGASPSPLPVPDAALTFVDASPAIVSSAAGGGVAWQTLSLSVWLGGAALFFAWHWLSYRRFAAHALDNADWLDSDGPVPIAASAAITSPVALGIFGRRVLVPADFAHRYDPREQRLALDHELAHHRRLDLPVNMAALAMLALHWFNPIAHIAHRAFRLDQEAACDAIVLDRAAPEDRFAYGTALYKSATGAMPLAVCALGEASQLKLRLRLIVSGEASRAWMQCGGALATVIVMMGVIITASSRVAAVAAERVEAPVAVVAAAEADRASLGVIAAERRAAVAAAKAERAKSVAERAEWRSERARMAADRARVRSQAAMPAVPVAPAAPAPLSPPPMTAPVAPPAPAVSTASIHASRKCDGDAHGVATTIAMAGGATHRINVSMCRKAITAQARATAIQGVISARDEIASDPTIPAATKSALLLRLDNQVRALTIRHFVAQ